MRRLLLAIALSLMAFSASADDYNVTIMNGDKIFLNTVVSTNDLTVECDGLKKVTEEDEDIFYSTCLNYTISKPYVKSITTDLYSGNKTIELDSFNYGMVVGLKDDEDNLFVSVSMSHIIDDSNLDTPDGSLYLHKLKVSRMDRYFKGDAKFNFKHFNDTWDFKIEKIKD